MKVFIMMGSEPTLDEHIEALKRSNFPTVLVEGKDDLLVYRRIEEMIGPTKVSLYPCGGRSMALEIQRRLRESGLFLTVAIVDSDVWTLEGAPIQTSRGVRTTYGYSVENDAIIFAKLTTLLKSKTEVETFQLELDDYADWYAIQIQFDDSGEDAAFRQPIGTVLDNPGIRKKTTDRYAHRVPCTETIEEVKSTPLQHIRGKNLLQLIARQTAARGRTPQFTGKHLLESAVIGMVEYLNDLTSWVCKELSLPPTAPPP